MMTLRSLQALALVVAVALLGGSLAACGTDPQTPAVPSPTPTDTAWTIAVLAPLTGPRADEGRGLLQSVQTQVNLRSKSLKAAGLTVKVLALDDRGQPSVGQQQATRLPDDASVVAVIGGVTSLVNEGVQPILNSAGLAMVAPGGGAPWLTGRGTPARRAFSTYFRLCAQDADQGAAAAGRALAQGDRRSVVLEDGSADHAAVSRSFVRTFSRTAGTAATRIRVDVGDAQALPAATIDRIAALKPQTVFLSVDAGDLPLIKESLARGGVRPRLVTTLPKNSPATPIESPDVWTGVSAASIGALPSTLPGRFPFATPTPTTEPVVEPGLFGAGGLDAASLIMDALIRARPTSSSVQPNATLTPTGSAVDGATLSLRRQIVDSVSAASIKGATGPVSFDSFGNARSRPVGFFTYDGKAWVPQPAMIVRDGVVSRGVVSTEPRIGR